MKKKFILLLTFITGFFLHSGAQNLLDNYKQSTYTYIYKLDARQAAEIYYQRVLKDSLKYFTSLVDSYRYDQSYDVEKLKPGHYLFINATEGLVRYWCYESPAFFVKTAGINREIRVFVYDLQGHVVRDAGLKVMKSGDTIKFSEDCGCYPIPLAKNRHRDDKREFIIQRGNDFTYHSVVSNLQNYEVKKKRKKQSNQGNYSYSTILPGYLVLNQPKFKLLDTVIWKAFLLKKNGKPMKKAVKVMIYSYTQNKIYLQKTLKPVSKGAYTDRFAVSDTFLMDDNYQVNIYSKKKNRFLKSESFRVENYDLKKSYFNSTINKNYIYAGEAVKFTITAYDANKLPLLDAKVKVDVILNAVNDFYDDSLFVPFSWSKLYWSFETLTDPDGETEITLPDSLFLNAKMSFNATVTLTNSDGDRQQFNHSFSFDPLTDRYIFYREGDSIHISFLHNSKQAKGAGILKALNNTLLYEKQIDLPYSFKIEDFPNQYLLYVNKNNVASFSQTDLDAFYPFFTGDRTYDSVKIQLNNPLDLEISYKIYNGDKKIAGGSGRKISLVKNLPGGETVHVIYSYRWRGSEYIKENIFSLNDKKLKVSIDQPELVYPGQKVAVKVNVRDFKNRNKKNVNLTAYAVNGQFENLKEPDIPDFGPVPAGMLNSFSTYNLPVSINNTLSVSAFYIRLMNLYQSPYYRLVYAQNGYGIVYEPIKSDTPEFAPFLIKDGQPRNIYAIFVNNDPVYYSWTNLKNPYSFRYEPGIYNIDIRTVDKMISLKNVELKKGNKLFLCLREDSIKNLPATSYVTMEKQLSPNEKQLIEKHLLFFLNKGIYSDYYLKQGSQIYRGSDFQNFNFHTKYIQHYTAGPFNRGPVTVILPGNKTYEFYFDPGYIYSFYSDSVSVTSMKPDWINIPVIPETQVSGMLFQQRPYFIPVPAPPQNVPPVKPQPPKRTHPGLRNYAVNYSDSGYAYLYLKNPTGRHIKNIWLFNRDNEKNSRVYFNPNLFCTFLVPGRYDLVVQTYTDSFLLITNIVIKPNGTNYRILKSAGFLPYDSVQFKAWEDRIISLNTPPPRVFNNPPVIINDAVTETKVIVNDKRRFSGFLMDNNSNPINYATIFIEKNGIFIAGAISNEAGYFEVKDLNPDVYQLKIFVSGKFYNIYQVLVSATKNTGIRIYLPNISGNNYRWDNTVYDKQGTSNDNYTSYAAPLVERDEGSGVYLMAREIAKSPVRNIAGVMAYSAGIAGKLASTISATGQQEEINTAVSPNEGNKFKAFLDKLKSDTNANRIRSNFRDYAYFIPNLITDKKGEAHFTVVFPDNQTVWKTFVPAMDYHKNSGLGIKETKSYKPLNANLALPKFLVENDSLQIIGKVYNYSGENVNVNSFFKLDDLTLATWQSEITTLKLDTTWISVHKNGNYHMTYAFTTNDDYLDGEKRKLPVLVNGIESVRGIHLEAENDTQIILQPDTSLVKRKVIITNNRLDLLLEEIEKLRNYSYGCNEQNASKLKALLLEKSIMQFLGKPFTEDKMIVSLIRRLEKTQHKDGSWGWWNVNDEIETWMTIYITGAIDMAVKAGFHSRAHIRGAEFIRNNFKSLDLSGKLYAMELLSGFYDKMDYMTYMLQFDSLNLSLQDRFRLIRLQQRNGLNYDITAVTTSMVKTTSGIYWGENVLDFKTNIIQTSALAYKILNNDTVRHPELLHQVRKYFLTHTETGRNTIEQATMLEMLVTDIIKDNLVQKELVPALTVGRNELAKPEFPLVLKYSKNDTVSISKKGATVYLSVYEYKTDKNPERVDSLYKINSWFFQSGKKSDTLKKGIAADYYADIIAIKSAEYVMIEIPIPSSCYYLDKNTGQMPYEIHREYFDDKVVVFCKNLPKGKYRLSVSLQPRFEGTSTVLPVKASMMYFPDRSGLGEKRKILVVN